MSRFSIISGQIFSLSPLFHAYFSQEATIKQSLLGIHEWLPDLEPSVHTNIIKSKTYATNMPEYRGNLIFICGSWMTEYMVCLIVEILQSRRGHKIFWLLAMDGFVGGSDGRWRKSAKSMRAAVALSRGIYDQAVT